MTREELLDAISGHCTDADLDAILAQVQLAPPSAYTLPSPLTPDSTEEEAADFHEAWTRHTMRVAAGDIEALLAEHNAALAAYRERVANLALAKRDPFDPQMLAYSRGFFAGVDHALVKSPARAKTLLANGATAPETGTVRPPAWREA